jgi:TonB family protein
MSCFLKRVLPFALTLTIGLLIGSLFGSLRAPKFYEAGRFEASYGDGRMSGNFHHGCRNAYYYNAPVVITRKPEAMYTAEARRDRVKGIVGLNVTLNSDGTVSDIVAVKELSGGLTEEAIKAARRIEFKPAYAYGRPMNATQYVEYVFDGNGPTSSAVTGFD